MAQHNELGKAGEDAAMAHLRDKGYAILHRNWKRGKLELDLVAAKGDEVAIIEVKTRKSGSLMEPLAAVNAQKIRKIVVAANTYLKAYKVQGRVRFDVITVVGKEGGFEVTHIEKAFYPPRMN